MIIAVNTRLLLKGKMDGIAWFTYYSLKHITQNHPEHQFYFIFDRPYNQDFIFSDNITPVIISPPTRHPFLWFYWFEFAVPKFLKKIKADLFLSPDGYISLRTRVLQIPVIHDINFKHNPKDIRFFARNYYNFYFPKFAHKAIQIATVSNYSKNDISTSYNIPKSKIDVVYNGSADIYKPLNINEKIEIQKEYTEGEEYFIFIGSLSPRKNVGRLFKAYDLFKQKTNSTFKLVIVGADLHKTSEIYKIFSSLNFKKDVIFTGHLGREQLHKLLASSYALTFVPYFEGFGIPIIEAMNCNVPVIASNVTSMPEVAGDAALYVNPFSVQEIADAMETLYSDKEFCKDLVNKAQIQKTKFSWEKTAERLWQTVEKVLNLGSVL